MAANLTPQYLEAEAEYKKAQTAEERLACLKKMYSLLPKHKASEKLQADLKTKISEAREEAERERKSPKKAGVSHKIPKQGAGQYVIIGAPNSGKSRLLTKLTRATPEVAAYPFTTREPHAGMMEWEDVRVQLIDTPPITADYLESYVQAVVRDLFGSRFPIHALAAETGAGLPELRDAIYRFLNVIRVYTQKPGKKPDMDSPFTCPAGSTVIELAAIVHRDF